MNGILETITQYVLPHWPFVLMAFLLGGAGVVMKTRVWTKEKASISKLFWWSRALLPLHAPVAGALFAFIAEKFGTAPVSPGVDGTFAVMLYYAAAGMASSHVYAAFKYFLKSKGIVAERVSMPPTGS